MDDLQKTAARFIDLYDQALKAKGLYTVVGIEQEFHLERDSAQNDQNTQGKRKEALQYARQAERSYYSYRSIADKLKRPVGLGPVERFYPEFPHSYSTPVEQFEITSGPSGPRRAAQRIEGFRAALSGHVPGNKGYSDDKAKWQVKALEFPAHKDEKGTYGMHINVSLQYKSSPDAESVYLMSPYCKDPRDMGLVTKHLAEGLRNFAQSDTLLFADTPRAYERFHGNTFNGTPHTVEHGLKTKPVLNDGENFYDPRQRRLEFRLPSGNADPYLSTLMVMAAVYQQFGKVEPGASNDGPQMALDRSFSRELQKAVEGQDVHNSKLAATVDEARTGFVIDGKVAESMKHIAEQFGTPDDQKAAASFVGDVLARSKAMQLAETRHYQQTSR